RRALPGRRRPPGGAARGRPGLPARPPGGGGRPPGRDPLRGDVPLAGALPPVRPVQARRRGADRGPHGGGALVSGPAPAPTPGPERVLLPISGMTCASCAARIERRLNRLEGVEASVNY